MRNADNPPVLETPNHLLDEDDLVCDGLVSLDLQQHVVMILDRIINTLRTVLFLCSDSVLERFSDDLRHFTQNPKSHLLVLEEKPGGSRCTLTEIEQLSLPANVAKYKYLLSKNIKCKTQAGYASFNLTVFN